MKTCHTEHMSMNEFTDSFLALPYGQTLVYAMGDIGYSIDKTEKEIQGAELKGLRALVWEAYKRGELLLTQRRANERQFTALRDATSFEYRATKHSPKVLTTGKIA